MLKHPSKKYGYFIYVCHFLPEIILHKKSILSFDGKFILQDQKIGSLQTFTFFTWTYSSFNNQTILTVYFSNVNKSFTFFWMHRNLNTLYLFIHILLLVIFFRTHALVLWRSLMGNNSAKAVQLSEKNVLWSKHIIIETWPKNVYLNSSVNVWQFKHQNTPSDETFWPSSFIYWQRLTDALFWLYIRMFNWCQAMTTAVLHGVKKHWLTAFLACFA